MIHRLGAAIVFALALTLVAACPASALTFTVNSTGDDSDSSGGDNSCDSDGIPGTPFVCTLRAAIQEANDDTFDVVDEINFAPAIVNDPDAADRTINLSLGLPDLSEQVSIDGCALASAQPPTQPCVGVRAPNTSTAIIGSIAADDVVIRSLAFGNASAAFGLSFGNSGLTVENNWFGVDLAGANDLMANGVGVTGNGSTIGGSTAAKANVFANITDTALTINGDNNQVLGNLFGVKPDGTTSAGNGTAIGVFGPNSVDPAIGNTIGGTQPIPGSCTGPCNVIANSSGSGVLLQQSTRLASNTTISGNFIGIDQAGALDPNNNVGINNLNATETTIGGAAAGERNYISGGGTGVAAAAQGAPGLEVRNNFIGIAPAGTTALGAPTGNGIIVASKASSPALVSGNRIAAGPFAQAISVTNVDAVTTTGATVSDNIVGLGTGNQDLGGGDTGIRATGLTDASITGNTLTNNSFAAISLENADDNTVIGNRINTDPSGGGDHSGVGGGIIFDDNPTPSTGNTIGGDTAASENLISNVNHSPIEVRLGANDANTFGHNRGTNNSDIFIDLGDDGAGNDNLDAPNDGIGAPTITAATDDMVSGSGAVANATALIFQTPDSGDPTDISSFVGQATASAAGAWQLPVNIANGTRVTALQTDASGDSSELSSSLAAVADPPETTITGGPRKRSRLKRGKRKKKVTFTFTSSEPGEGGFQCQIDSTPFVLCSSPFVRKLKKGKHTFRVRAFDDASNPDPSLAIRTFRIRAIRPR